MSNTKKVKKDEEMVEVTADGKREIVEGKEPLKKDPVARRWKVLKKALSHEKAFMDLDEALGGDEQAQPGQPPQEEPQGDTAQDLQQELSPEGGEEPPSDEAPEEAPQDEAPQEDGQEEEAPEDDQADSEAVSAGDEGTEEPPADEDSQGDQSPVDPQELIEALKEEGYSDQEIAYIVHGQHAAEVDPSKQAAAQAKQAMGEHDVDAAKQMAEIERQHALASMEHERSHKQRMSDLEYDDASNKKNETNMQQAHKQRMLDLEYERAKKESEVPTDDGGEGEANREMKRLEVEKKKLELKLREAEMKLELEFKQKEHELKLKMMEQQLKDQAKQKGEIGAIKHKQKLADAKNPPEKKPLKKNEEDDEQD